MDPSDADRARLMRELEELHRLDREALEACREAERRLEGSEWQRAVAELAEEHERRAEEIATLLRRFGSEPSSGDSRPTARAKRRSVVAGAMGGDRGVLLTLLAAEQAAAQRVGELPQELRTLVARRAEEEHAHLAVLAEGVARLSGTAS